MEKKKGQLCLSERQAVYVMRERGVGVREIARQLGRNASTVAREPRRNAAQAHLARHMTALEKAVFAQRKAKDRQREKVRRRSTVLDRRADVRQRMVALLQQTNYSPETVGEILSTSDLGVKLHGKTIRRWIRKHCPNFQRHFPHRGKRPRVHLTPRQRRKKEAAPTKRSIFERPQSVANRTDAGDFELDMVVCRQSNSAVLSVRDRKTRKAWLRLVPNLKADTLSLEILRVLRAIPPALRRSCTYDRGSEFAAVHKLEPLFGIVNYFCDAYAAWQKGSVEQQNKELRRYLPKGTDLSTVTPEHLLRIEALLNSKPRRVLGGLCADDAWFFECRAAAFTLH